MIKSKTGIFTPKNKEKYIGTWPIVWRSSWELRMMMWADNNPNIISYSSESIVIPYYNPVKGRRARYFPDFLLKIKNKDGEIDEWLVELKPFCQTIPPISKPRQKLKTKLFNESTYIINMAKWEAAQEFCKQNGLKWKILTEKELFKR